MKKLWLIRKDQEAVSPVIATILMVAITVVLAAVLYVMVSGLLGGGTTTRPVITFASLSKGGTPPTNHTATWSLAGASEPISVFAAFKVQITKDGSPLVATAQAMAANSKIVFGTTVTLIVRDLAGEGKLTGGDTFLVYGMGEPGSWKFSLIWSADGGELQSASWSTP